MQLTWFATLGGAAESQSRGASFRWRCLGCARWTEMDFADYLAMEGPTFPTWNLLSECPACQAPRSLHASPGAATPYLPLKDEALWVLAEIGYGRDPQAWFEIHWMD